MAKIAFRGSAVFSECGSYRYRLDRDFGRPGPVHLWIMLNPSTADAETNDPTVRRCVGYSHAWGAGRMVVANVYALRSTDPRALKGHDDPIGPDNGRTLGALAREADLVICAWGVHGGEPAREVARTLDACGVDLHALAVTKGGDPAHPLYLAGGLTPVRYHVREG